jgi:hypothetical protein
MRARTAVFLARRDRLLLRRVRLAGLALVSALACCAGVASMAQADEYKLSDPIVQRLGQTGFDWGYRGPQFTVTRWGTSSDTYDCPGSQTVSNLVVVGDVADSVDRGFSTGTIGAGTQVDVIVTNWSLASSVYLRLAASCTNATSEFPFPPRRLDPYPPGDYKPYWDGVFKTGSPGAPEYAELIQRAFCWSPEYPGCPPGLAAPTGTKRFAVRNGANRISVPFTHLAGRRPPAVHLAGAAGCRARRMQMSVHNRSGHLRLLLRCRSVSRGATARVTIGRPIVRRFRLRRGGGRLRVHLAKPPGTIEPYAYVSYGPRGTRCRSVRHRLHLRSRTLSLRVNARCGRVAGNTRGHLYVGGLVATQTPRQQFQAVCEGHGGGFRTGPGRWLCGFAASVSQETIAALAAPCRAAGGSLSSDQGTDRTTVTCRL